ncbi:MAG: dUTP diphosphatase [Dehalococcoidia bacterium]
MDDALQLQVMLLRPGARLPARHSDLASGFDLHACLDGGTIEVGPVPVLVPTGVAIASPHGTDVQIRPRSGLSAKGVMSAFGTIDADYRGELFVTMYCLAATGTYVVRHGDRVAQLVIARLADVAWTVVEHLDATSRGTGGHGSTGRS